MSIVRDIVHAILNKTFNLTTDGSSRSSIHTLKHGRLVECAQCEALDKAIMNNIEVQYEPFVVIIVYKKKIARIYYEKTGR